MPRGRPGSGVHLLEDRDASAAPAARALGLKDKGHLGVGADADITIYEDDPDKEKMFSTPRYVLKDGKLIIADHEFRADHDGRVLHATPAYDPDIEKAIRPFFELLQHPV